jgi:FlaA1/EpsC-like NDP-sugar epimerase
MKKVIRNKNFYFMVLIDVILVGLALFCAYLLRFEGKIPDQEWLNFTRTLPFIVAAKILIFFICQMYKGMWRFTSLIDLVNAIKAAVISSALIITAILFINRFNGFPRSVFIIDGFLTFFFVGGIRVTIRIFFDNGQMGFFPMHTHNSQLLKKILIIGAGSASEKALREIQSNSGVKMEPIGLLDDDPLKQGKSIHGIPVLGTTSDLEDLSIPYDEILIAIPSLKSEGMRRIVAMCERTGKKFRTMPSLGELIGGKISVNAIREVTIEDLLGRDEVRLEQDQIRRLLYQKRVLVTGAGGSIGSELVRQICRFHPQSIALLDFSEYNLFKIEMECRQKSGFISATAFLTDIRDRGTLTRVFRQVEPQVVFHAAAYKHVPIQELHPWEAVFNNVLGTKNVVDVSIEEAVEKFVFVSTDKAVRPTNVMGATKRIAEMFAGSANSVNSTRFVSVRFGNVLGSSGSAVPVFQEQIARGGPVTVTHPEVTRYFMSIPEAAQLILQAAAMGEGGEIFILDMGRPVRILDLVEDLIRLNGLEPQRDIPIQFVGLRPGEKLIEELITNEEGIISTEHEKIMVLRGKENDHAMLKSAITALLSIAKTYNALLIKDKIQELVPEYVPDMDSQSFINSKVRTGVVYNFTRPV